MATRTEQIEGRGDPRLGKAHRGAQHSCCDASHYHVSPMRATTAYLLTSSPQSSLVPAGGKERWHMATQVRHSSHSFLLPSSRSLGGSLHQRQGSASRKGDRKRQVSRHRCQACWYPIQPARRFRSLWYGRAVATTHPPTHFLSSSPCGGRRFGPVGPP